MNSDNGKLRFGVLHRPAQDCSRTYAGAVTINRILQLSPTTFQEQTVAHLTTPRDGPYPGGLRTLNAVGDVTIIDGKKFTFYLLAYMRKRAGTKANRKRSAHPP